MAISNCFFSLTSENLAEFSAYRVLTKFSINPRNYSSPRPLANIPVKNQKRMKFLDIFRKDNYEPQITVEKFNHFFEYSALTYLTGLGHDAVVQGVDIGGISFKKAYHHKGNSLFPNPQDIPQHIRWFKNPLFITVALVNGKIEYYFTDTGEVTFFEITATTNKEKIKFINEVFEHYYTYLDLPRCLEKLKNPVKISRRGKMKHFESYLSSTDKESFADHFVEVDDKIYDIAMWVDWKEYDPDIIQYCIDILKDKELSVSVDEDIQEERGIDIFITYKGLKTKIDYASEYTNRNTTLKALNKAINDDYEIRFCSESNGDTLCFIPLTNKQWGDLEKKYPNEVSEKFEKIKEDSTFFD